MTDEQTPTLPSPSPYSEPLSASDERTWAMLAHLSVLTNLFTGFAGVVIALVIYLAYKDRSKYVAHQSFQSFLFQLIFWVGGGALAGIAWTVSGVLTVLLIGFLLMPIACVISLLPFAALVYGTIAAVQCSRGDDFSYWLVGDWARGAVNS